MKNPLGLSPAIALLLILGACQERPLGRKEGKAPEGATRSVDRISPAPSIDHGLRSAISFDLKMSVETPEKSRRFKANMRLYPDSLVWGSVAPAFGIEAFRILLSKDSVHFLDRMNDRFFVGKAARSGSRFGIPMELSLFQSMLFGGVPLAHDEGFQVLDEASDSSYYRPVMDSGLTKLIGLDASGDPFEMVELKPRGMARDSLALLLDEKEMESRFPFYWTVDSGKTISRSMFLDLEERTVLDLRYIERQDFQRGRVPALVRGRVRSSKGISTFEMRIRDLKASEKLRFPFSVPDGYEPLRP